MKLSFDPNIRTLFEQEGSARALRGRAFAAAFAGHAQCVRLALPSKREGKD